MSSINNDYFHCTPISLLTSSKLLRLTPCPLFRPVRPVARPVFSGAPARYGGAAGLVSKSKLAALDSFPASKLSAGQDLRPKFHSRTRDPGTRLSFSKFRRNRLSALASSGRPASVGRCCATVAVNSDVQVPLPRPLSMTPSSPRQPLHDGDFSSQPPNLSCITLKWPSIPSCPPPDARTALSRRADFR